jgi:hypothetical protein
MLSLILLKNAHNRIQEYTKQIIMSYSNSGHKAFIHLMSLNYYLIISCIFLTATVQLFWLGLTLYLLVRALRAHRLLKFVFCY